MANFFDQVAKIANTTTDIINQAASVAAKVKGFTLPSVSTNAGVPANIQMASPSKPGVQQPGTIDTSSATTYLLIAGVGVLAIFLLRK